MPIWFQQLSYLCMITYLDYKYSNDSSINADFMRWLDFFSLLSSSSFSSFFFGGGGRGANVSILYMD